MEWMMIKDGISICLVYVQIHCVEIVFVNVVLVRIIHRVHVKQRQVQFVLPGENEHRYLQYSPIKHEIIFDDY